MKCSLLTLLSLISVLASAQPKNYNVAVGYGVYGVSGFKQSHPKDFILADFSYQLTTKWAITSGLTTGRFNYYDDLRSNAFDEVTKFTTTNTNARGYDLHTYLLANYSIHRSKKIDLQTAAGIGLLTQRLKYPYREPCSSGCAVFIGESSVSMVSLPVRVTVHYLFTDRVSGGLVAGGFYTVGSSAVSFQLGPQIQVSL